MTSVVLIPGTQCTDEVFAPLVEALRAGLPGLVTSTRLVGGHDIDDAADRVLRGHTEPVVLLGHSLGGTVALAAQRRHPERVKGVITVCTNPRAPTPEQHTQWDRSERRVRSGGYAAIAPDLLPSLLSADDVEPHGEVARTCLRMAEQLPVTYYLQQLDVQRSRQDERSTSVRRRTPVLSVGAGDDRLVEPRATQEVALGSCDGQWRILPQGSHMLPLTRPHELSTLILPWLRTLLHDAEQGPEEGVRHGTHHQRHTAGSGSPHHPPR